VVFIENDPAAQAALRSNIRALGAEPACTVHAADATAIRTAPQPASLVFLDPPYGQGLMPRALSSLRMAGWIAPGTVIVAEMHRDEPPAHQHILAERRHGIARLTIWREGGGPV
jgi:16S rRNA (guanine966-N2)-methyltransferase